MEIAIYARVSSESQAKEGTIQSQLEALREYAKAENHQVMMECLDDGYSGADLNRPGLDQLRDLISEGLVEAVLVLSPDRLSRKQAHQIILLEEFRKHNVKAIFTSQPSGDTAEDQLLLNIQGAISEYERAKILDRTRRGTKHAVRNGQVIGSNPPYGYRFVRKTKDHPATYAIDEQEAETVKRIFDWYLRDGLKGPSIAKRLEDEGVPSRSRFNTWHASTVYAILKNETYTGVAYMNKTISVEPSKHPKVARYRQRRKSSKADRPREDWIGVPVPAILDKTVWEKAQQRLKENAAHSKRNNKKRNYLLRGLVVCGLCGSMAPGHVSNKHTYYSCGARRNKNMTTTPHDERVAVDHSKLDEKVWNGLVQLLDDPEQLKAQLERKVERLNQPIKVDKGNLYKIEQELVRLAQQEKRLLDAYREGIIELGELREQKAKVVKQLHAAKAKQKAIQNVQGGLGASEITLSELVDLSAVYKRAMSKADTSTKQNIANLLINRVKLYPQKAVVEGIIPLDPDALVPSKHASPLSFAMINPTPSITVLPANQASCADLAAVFGERGYAADCQCQFFKTRGRDWDDRVGGHEERAVALRQQTHCGQPDTEHTSGLVAYLDGEPVGWCAVEPRTAYIRLQKKPLVWKGRDEDKADDSVWSIVCMSTRAGYRKRGVTYALAKAAVDYARSRGARALEGYPMLVDPGEEVTWGQLYVGHRKVFEAAGFKQVSHPTKKRVVMRIDF